MPSLSAIVTGGASGIGEAVATKLASRGVNVTIADLDTKAGEALAKKLESDFGAAAVFVRTDVSQEDDVKAMVEAAVKRFGRLDFAANCAGVSETVWHEEQSITTRDFDRVYSINAKGVWLCQKHEAAQMQRQSPRPISLSGPSSSRAIPGQRGSIVHISSVCGLISQGLGAYTPAKHAVLGITKNGAKFYGKDQIRVNAVCPGWVYTPLLEKVMGQQGVAGTAETEQSPVLDRIMLGRMSFPEEQASVISFLLSDDSSYINGAHIVVDGGFVDIHP
ncbi:2,5-dichloro-2,5-cyclohexadiene-1,4-diol dehydrogenase [Fonsecaea pedrosoi]|nr:2,5-dichloro-2,5-cyclohexadiene-1,4-diol dehydrogenase [Fonsecaea pedrosoi]